MDWLKTILDRLSGLLASLIPGSVLFLLFALHQSAVVSWVWNTPLLTYSSKIVLSLFFSVAIGHTVNFAFTTLMTSLGAALGGYIAQGQVRPESDAVPWQNKNWRALITKYLGDAAPENINPVYDEVFEMRMNVIRNYPEEERAEIAAKLLREKATADLNDHEWREWWNHFHRASFFRKKPEALLYDQINGGFCTASLVVLIALPFTPELRIWWAIAISVFWIVILILRTIADIRAVMDPWSSYTSQVEQLEEKITSYKKRENGE